MRLCLRLLSALELLRPDCLAHLCARRRPIYIPCPQAKLQQAQQQREYAKAFHADVLKGLAADEAQQQVRAHI